MTAGQQAILDGFNANLAEHGQTWTRTNDNQTYSGIATKLEPTHPRMPGSQDRHFPVLISDSEMALYEHLTDSSGNWLVDGNGNYLIFNRRLQAGDELTKETSQDLKKYRVVRLDYDEPTALWTVILNPYY